MKTVNDLLKRPSAKALAKMHRKLFVEAIQQTGADQPINLAKALNFADKSVLDYAIHVKYQPTDVEE